MDKKVPIYHFIRKDFAISMSNLLPIPPFVETAEIQKTFSDRLMVRRKEKGYTQEQLATFLGVNIKTYRSWEKDALPKSTELFNLSNILDCSIDYLFGKISQDTQIRKYIDTYFSLSYQAFDKLMLLSFLKDKNKSRIASDISWILEYLIVTEDGNELLDLIRQFAFGYESDNISEIDFHYDLTVKKILSGKEKYCHISHQNTSKQIIDEYVLNLIHTQLEKMGAKHNKAYLVKPDNSKIMPPVN